MPAQLPANTQGRPSARGRLQLRVNMIRHLLCLLGLLGAAAAGGDALAKAKADFLARWGDQYGYGDLRIDEVWAKVGLRRGHVPSPPPQPLPPLVPLKMGQGCRRSLRR